MDINELIASIEVEKEAAEKREAKARAGVKLILETARQDGRTTLSDEENVETDSHFGNITLAKSQLDGIKGKLSRAMKVKAEELDADGRSKTVAPSPEYRRPAYDEVARVTREERTYHRGNDPYGKNFLRDVARQFVYNDVGSGVRLSRHMAEERVENAQYLARAAGDTTTTNWAGLTVPQYLTDFVAPAIAGLRPLADVCNHHPLPPNGLSVNYSRVTTASSAAVQASELSAVSSTTVDDTLGTANVLTAAGSQNVSRQAIDRGTNIDDTVLQDLYSRYATALDASLLTLATYGLTAVSGTSAPYVDGAPTAAKLYSKIQGAAAAVETNMLAMGTPDVCVMHPRRWYYLTGAQVSTWPLITSQPMAPLVAGQNTSVAYNQGVRGVLPNGLRVIGDANIGTTLGAGSEDAIFVCPSRELHLWEDPGAPVFIRAEQPNVASLGVLLVVYGYYAFAFNRYANGMQMIAGSGLIAPAF
jgi:HK97 family phage major capsid protein